MNAEPKFWRLLAEYEQLSHDETVAQSEENFPALAEIDSVKTDLLGRLKTLGAQLGIDRTNPDLRKRLDILQAAQNEKITTVEQHLADLRLVQQQLAQADARVRTFGHAYVPAANAEPIRPVLDLHG